MTLDDDGLPPMAEGATGLRWEALPGCWYLTTQREVMGCVWRTSAGHWRWNEATGEPRGSGTLHDCARALVRAVRPA